jgi:hypothetical protein
MHVFLGVLYSVVVPLWESYDEWGHYPYVEYIATERTLPRERLTNRNDETHQPPLYYILGALATFWVDTSDDFVMIPNEYSVHRGGEGGVNLHLHLDDEEFPYRGTVLAAHITRLVSVLLGTVSVWATYLIARTLFPSRRKLALGSLAVSAFWPQLLFLSSVVTNDVMVTACGSLVLLFLAKILAHSASLWDLLGLGVSLGAGLLSKRNGLALVPFVVVGLGIAAIRKDQFEKKMLTLLGGSGLILVGVALTSGWWLKGLQDRYQGYILRIFSMLSHPAQIAQLHWERLPSALYFCLATFFAAFGHLLLGVEAWIYRLVALICLTAISGLVIFWINKRASSKDKISITILVLHILALLAAPAYRTLTAGGGGDAPTVISSVQQSPPLLFEKNVFLFQGRFMLPAISSFSILLVLGIVSLLPKRLTGRSVACIGVVLLAFAILTPFRYIRPAYARPRLLSPSDVQELEHPVQIEFDDKIELIGYEVKGQNVFAGSEASVTLYWRCLEGMEQNYPLTIEVLNSYAQVYGRLRLHPGYGSFPTSLWEEGDIFRETYRVSIASEIPTPSQAYFKVSFQKPDLPDKKLKPHNVQGDPVEASFGHLIVRAQKQPQVENPTRYELGGQVALKGYEVIASPVEGEDLKVTLYWSALTAISENYTVFVHVLDREGQLVAQQDRQPKEGLAPTSIWQEGVVVEDEYQLSIPSGSAGEQHRVQVGMYNLDTMERLPAFDADGSRLPDDVIVITEIESASLD